jgi:hypothetical protein
LYKKPACAHTGFFVAFFLQKGVDIEANDGFNLLIINQLKKSPQGPVDKLRPAEPAKALIFKHC